MTTPSEEVVISSAVWPPRFTLDQEAILNLLTGDRFYSNPSAALREAVLNAIDAIHRGRRIEGDLLPEILVTFDAVALSLTVSDNGIGMSREDVTALFTKVGASAATHEANKQSVGEFGIGVISYFMAGDSFVLRTFDGKTSAVGLGFHRGMLAGGASEPVDPIRTVRGTTIELQLRDRPTFELLVNSFAHWCRDVDGLVGRLVPDMVDLQQGDTRRVEATIVVDHPDWVERAHLAPVADPTGWDAMTGVSTVSVLYRGVFVQEFEVRGLWGIQGSVDVDPKHFKPRLNREGFIAGQFQSEVEGFLRTVHPSILEAMAGRLSLAVSAGDLDKWTEKRWANLWLSVPREGAYSQAVRAWDTVFRSLPAFELATGNNWVPASLDELSKVTEDIYVAPLADDNTTDVVRAALRLLRNSGKTVIRGIKKDRSWMRYAGAAFGTTADLITTVFGDELPPLIPIANQAEIVLAAMVRVAPLFTGPPAVDLVRLGADSPPALRLADRLVINVDHAAGQEIVREVLLMNAGPASLIGIAARHAYDQLAQVAAVVKDNHDDPEVLSPMRQRFIRDCLS